MDDPADKVLREVGRIVIRAAALEAALGAVAGERLGMNSMDTLGKPGGALKYSRLAVETLTDEQQAYFTPAIDEARDLILKRHAIIHAIWLTDGPTGRLPEPVVFHMRTFARVDTATSTLNQYCYDLECSRRRITSLLTSLINRLTLDAEWPD